GGRNEMGWLRHMYEGARQIAQQRGYAPPAFEEFWAQGFYEFPLPERDETFMGAFRENPQLNELRTPSGKIEITSAGIGNFGYDDCPRHPTWLEPAEWLGSAKAGRYPLHLLSNQPTSRLHSQMDVSTLSRASKLNGREPLRLSQEDAAARGVTEGDLVR